MAREQFTPRISLGTMLLMWLVSIFIDTVQIILNIMVIGGIGVNLVLISLPAEGLFTFWFGLYGINFFFPKQRKLSESKTVKQAAQVIKKLNWKPLMELLVFIPYLDTIPWLTISVIQLTLSSRKDDRLEYNERQAAQKKREREEEESYPPEWPTTE